MAIDVEEKGSECGCVDDAQTVRLAGFKWQRSILVESNFRSQSRCPRARTQVRAVLIEINEA
jgi:hypothetical protein